MSRIPFTNCCRVNSLAQLYDYIEFIQKHALGAKAGEGTIAPVWFRGQYHASYELIPSLMRKNRITLVGEEYAYSTMQVQEDERYHGFRAKVNHLFNNHPDTRIEWEELMQHHYISTRLMDWTESIQTALAFALESLLDPGDDDALKKKRQGIEPVIWALFPQKLNRIVYEAVRTKENVEKALSALESDESELTEVTQKIYNALEWNKKVYLDTPENSPKRPAMENMICLSVINQQRAICEANIYRMLKRLEFNPFYYLLSRYYSDGLPAKKPLPPMAALHPYHSDRIRAQQGAFTVFPINCHERLEGWVGENPDAMEYYPGMDQCLFEIRIANAPRIARELLLSGVRRSSLYPEPENYSKELEASRYYY